MNKTMNILVVDDATSIRLMMDLSLDNAGYQVSQAGDGEQALQLAKQQLFDLVITDINMPNMNGFVLITKLRALPGYEHTPILTLTTEDSDTKKQQGKKAGATGWITKPFSPEKLVTTINRLLGNTVPAGI